MIVRELPYAGTSGWSGSDTSRDRAAFDDASGRTTERQNEVIWALLAEGRWGLTWRELADDKGWHHGQASGVLSVLHKTGHIVRLRERRNRCAVYVMPLYVDDRDTAPYAANKKKICPSCGSAL